nr:MAG TPA: hypothetical protein [Caudoviricetes sp.]
MKIPECLSCPYCIVNIPPSNKKERYIAEFLELKNSNSRGKRSKEVTFL